ncbi:DUF6207 family protein [Streptomyces cacaoi]|uniref:DUF6207 family protein n=1 Tax=Streptomyces cacaoi TaxID=1898 RepID=UPI0037498723
MKTLDAENRGPWSACRDVAGPGLVVVEVAAADEETAFAFQVPAGSATSRRFMARPPATDAGGWP